MRRGGAARCVTVRNCEDAAVVRSAGADSVVPKQTTASKEWAVMKLLDFFRNWVSGPHHY